MERINPLFFYQLGALLTPVTQMEAKTLTRVDIWLRARSVSPVIYSLLDFYSALAVCRRTGGELINAITEAEDWINQTPADKWQQEDYSVDLKFQQIIDKAKEFQTVLSEELQMLDTYHVTQKGIYDTTALIERAENILPLPVLAKMAKGIVREIRESGRCLAFDCPTASGFHIIRAIEAVMHDYYILVCKPASKEKLKGWADYISALYKLTEDTNAEKSIREDAKKIIALLQLIKDQDRNLIMHPEVLLTPDDADKLLEIAKAAIIAMTDRLPPLKKK